ncbi:PREDICTED: defensin SD2-like isoform X2 [Lupinus angustifolius]|uniref:defensin SD2-like isoform X2 n=1 Tax=Lupinus angustifolius TaxID=3871 RepID=UPI00092EFC40|nr:PREDICTED: defensin SD2-like isoform X2 [Lupinus angustifolius]
MARSAPIVFTIFFFVIVLLANEMGPTLVAEAGTCFSKSKRFIGSCWGNAHCASVCKSEKLSGGHCSGSQCLCIRQCPKDSKNNGPPPPNQDGQPATPSPNLVAESTTAAPSKSH